MEEEEGQHENGRPQPGNLQQSDDVSEDRLINQYRKRNQFIPDVHRSVFMMWMSDKSSCCQPA